MRNPITRLLYIGIFGLGVSCAMIMENYLSKSNSTWEYIIAFILFAFSLTFFITGIVLGKKQK